MSEDEKQELEALLVRPTADRIFYLGEALRRGWSVERVYQLTKIDPWFLNRMADICAVEVALGQMKLEDMDAESFRVAKRYGLSDVQIAHLTKSDEKTVRAVRKILGVRPVFKTVDTCAAEFCSTTAYHY